MKYKFETVLDGISQYINDELMSRMNDLQEFGARVLVDRVINNQDTVKEYLVNNGFIRTFGIIDSDGMVDVIGLARDIKKEIAKKNKITFTVPMFGKLTFEPSDVDSLYYHITGEEYNENY